MSEVVPIPLGYVNPFLVRGEEGTALVDSGSPGRVEQILDKMAQAGLSPQDIHLILLTHGYTDHFGRALALRERTGAPIAIHALDAEAVRRGSNPPGGDRGRTWFVRLMRWLLHLLPMDCAPAFEPDLLLEEELDLRPRENVRRIIALNPRTIYASHGGPFHDLSPLLEQA